MTPTDEHPPARPEGAGGDESFRAVPPAERSLAGATMIGSVSPPPDNADVALLEAEREIDQLLAATEERPSATDDDPGFDRLTDRNQFVLTTPATTLAGAAAKLRRVLCPLIGLPAGDGEHDIQALTQALAVVERAAIGPNPQSMEFVGDVTFESVSDGQGDEPMSHEAWMERAHGQWQLACVSRPILKGTDADVEAMIRRMIDTEGDMLKGLEPYVEMVECLRSNIETMEAGAEVFNATMARLIIVLARFAGRDEKEASFGGVTPTPPADEDDAALIATEREFYASVAAMEQWSADNPDKSIDDNPEWARCFEIYDRILTLMPSGIVGVAAIIRVMLYRRWGALEAPPDNISDILTRMLPAIERTITPPQPERTGDDALLILLAGAHKQLVADRKVLGEAQDTAEAAGDRTEVTRIEAEDLKAYERAWDIIGEIASTPAISYAGLAVKLSIALDYEHLDGADEAVLEMLRSAQADVIKRVATIPPQPDPVLALLGELEQANEAIRRNEEAAKATAETDRHAVLDVEINKLIDQRIGIELRMAKTSGCSPAGALAKLRIIVQSWRDAPDSPEIPSWDKMDLDDKLVVSAMHDLECVTGERPAS